jgi:glucose-6-phosphate isomerase
MIITTGYETDLWNTANKAGIETLPIPDKVGDRFSIFSALGLFPLSCAGANIEAFLKGAKRARLEGLKEDIFENLPALSALINFSTFKKGLTIHDTFFFNPELESLGKWYRQLVAESLGKEGTGITPTVSIGSRDLHSTAQLYLAGPKDKFFTFVSTKDKKHPIRVPDDSIELLLDVMGTIEGKSADEITRAILLATKETFKRHELPFAEIILDEVSEKSLGHFMQFKMIEIMYLGNLLKVDAFNQPNVEEYKTETEKILSKDQ